MTSESGVYQLIEGLLAALGASTVWSLNPAIISRFSRDIKPIVFAGLKALVASIPLLVFLRNIHVDPDIGLLVAITSALLGPGLGDALYAQAIRILGGSLAVVVSYTYIFAASALSALFLGEKWGVTVIMGSILAFTGVIVGVGLTDRKTTLKLRGIIFALGAAMSWGVGTTLIRVALNYYDFTGLTAMRFLTVGVIFTIIGLKVERGLSVNSRRNLILASTLSGVLGLMVGGLLFTYAIWSVGVTATVITTSLTPVLSQWTTRLIARENIKATTVIGAVLVALGILVLYL